MLGFSKDFVVHVAFDIDTSIMHTCFTSCLMCEW